MNPVVWMRLLRPKSWVKNFLVFSALIFSGQFLSLPAIIDSTLVFAGFCLVASMGYLVNDWFDRHRDRHHPRKSNRPFASGEAGPPTLLVLLGLLGGGVYIVARALPDDVTLPVLGVLFGYLVIMMLYNLGLKHVFGVELLIVSVGILLRAVAGGVGIDVPMTNWFLLTILFLSLMIVTGKRRHERFTLREGAPIHRPVLSSYPIPMLDALLMISGSAALVTYTLWTVNESSATGPKSMALAASVLFVLWGMMRYLYLLYSGQGGAPETLFLKDKTLIVSIVLWLLYLVSLDLFNSTSTSLVRTVVPL